MILPIETSSLLGVMALIGTRCLKWVALTAILALAYGL
jgi:hypothetical protein